MKRILSAILCLGLACCAAQAQSSRGNLELSDDLTYGYLFCHMSDHGQWTAYALSQDGLHFHDLISGKPVFDQTKLAGIEGGTRDAYIFRAHNGSGYLMVTTDMNNSKTRELGKSSEWENYGIDLLRSDDLLNWKSTTFDFRKGLDIFMDGSDKAASVYKDWSKVCRVWAPQVIWDDDYVWADGRKGGYMVYFSMLNRAEEKYDRMYYCHADASFTQMTQPQVLFDWGYATIDADINWVEADSQYHLMIKKEGGQPGLFTSSAPALTGPWPQPDENDYIRFEGNKLCEGVSAFKVAGEEGWQIGYIEYSSNPRNYRICSADKNMRNFRNPQPIEGIDGPQHGSFMRVTKEEYDMLQKWSDSLEPWYLERDVNNPVFPGLYADPEALYSEKTGKYYIYPTTDGVFGWHNYDFHCFSSSDLKNWKDEGVILDLRDLDWGKEYAWAPCIIEKPIYKDKKHKKIEGYKYYFYFVANKTIGVAVADNPEGPFKDALGRPLITKEEAGTPNDVIDPDVFMDPATGKYYLYWGNSYMWMAELADDMVSFVPGTMKELIPRSKIGEYHYLEGSYVFERNGLYYFMWSENRTRSTFYQVRYLISESPTEFIRNGKPAKVEEQVVLHQVPEHQIFGTGHHSVLNIPGTDEWYMVYHRYTRPEGVKMGMSGGYNRETCIDKMEFNEDGTIKTVIPTL